MRPRLLILTPWFPNSPGQREGNFIHDSAAALAQQGLDVHVMVVRPWRPWPFSLLVPKWRRGQIEPKAFTGFRTIQQRHYLSAPRNLLGSLDKKMATRWLARKATRFVEEYDIDVIHAHTEGLADVALRVSDATGRPAVVTLHGVNTARNYFDHPGLRRDFRKALSAIDRVILVGEPLRSFFKEVAGSDYNFRVIHNGYSLNEVERESPIFSPGRPLRFVSVSNLEEGKGIDLNLEAFAALLKCGFDDWHYTIVGGGSQEKKLRAQCGALRLEKNVVFHGAQPHERVAEFLSESDVFVLPSWREAFGVAYLEAMASGSLSIGVRGQGAAEIIEHGETGILVAPRSVESLVAALARCVNREPRLLEIARRGQARVESDFTWHAHAKKLVQLYEGLEIVA